MTLPVEKLAYRIDEAVRATGLSESTLRRLNRAGELPMVKLHGRTLIRREALEALLNRYDEGAAA